MQKTFVQGGSVKVFVIVGVILTVLALTALYFVGKNFYGDQVPPMAVPESVNDENDQVDNDQAQDGSVNDEGGATSDEQEAADREGDSVPSGTSEQGGSGAVGPSESASDLPRTGPSDDLAASVGLVALTVSVASYIGSVRRMRTS